MTHLHLADCLWHLSMELMLEAMNGSETGLAHSKPLTIMQCTPSLQLQVSDCWCQVLAIDLLFKLFMMKTVSQLYCHISEMIEPTVE